MGKILDKDLILNRIKSHYKFKSDAALARHLGISTSAIGNWRGRKMMDFELVITKCDEMNPNWIINGEGKPIRTQYNSDETKTGLAADPPEVYGSAVLVDEVNRLAKIVTLQEETIAAQVKTIAVMEKLIGKHERKKASSATRTSKTSL